MALYALGDPSLAQDVAQEAITRALARASEVHEPANTAAFVAGIARHIITDHIRARRRIELDVTSVDIAEAHPDALAQLLSEEQRQQLKEALLSLSAGDREILRLSYEEGLSSDEIAHRLEETSAAVRKRKSRAIERLRASFMSIAEPAAPRHIRVPVPTVRKSIAISFLEGGAVAAEM